MKEYKTLRATPEGESNVMAYMEMCNWHLDNRQEVYNRSERVVGMTTETKMYGDFMRGFTGKDGEMTTHVQTEEEITHFIALSFSREADTKNHKKIVGLEAKLENFTYSDPKPLKKVPSFIGGFLIGLFFAIITAIASKVEGPSMFILTAIAGGYAGYCLFSMITGKRRKIQEENEDIEVDNELRREREKKELNKISDELAKLLAEEREELKERGLLR